MTSPSSHISYDEAVRLLQEDPSHTHLIEDSYLDRDVRAAAQRFASSDEWQEVKKWLKERSIHAPAKVLDLACGNGIASLAFAKEGYQVCALDPNMGKHSGLSALQEILCENPQLSVRIQEGVAEKIPLEDASMDLVYLRQAAHHFCDLEAGLRESYRVLRPGAYCFMTREHVVRNEQERTEFLNNHPLHALHGDEWAYAVHEYEDALRRAGFRSLKSIGTFLSPVNYAPLRRSDLNGWLQRGLERRFGKKIAERLMQMDWLFRAYAYFLEFHCRYPGRMFSFLARKPL